MSLELRITELESRLAFQDDNLLALNDVVVAQQRSIDLLQQQMTALIRRQEELLGQFGIAEDEPPPPHY
ncbi:SlyX family protein [Pseudomonas sp. N040]|uniref:SlyX family protein n=1 Tax=Pseudomonas sp. N040 TaxID=2785325 RepID=UPI0018A2FAD9|nr:SlyX family protein [Pseudomonas sp. N040]MBF7729371.1 SlyX family protein [Pseudomonas sp. N040]MBW7013011.1 SlyX family protein [Pseudomonas sp. N040]